MGKKRCIKCILPENYPGISFNNEGVCSYCTEKNSTDEINKLEVLGKENLVKLLQSSTKKGEYDCIVPVSGGKDSIYVLYYTVKELGLKPLVVTYNAGFQTQIALENIKNACKVLNVPFIIENVEKKLQLKLLKDILRISEKIGSFVRTCTNCSTLIRGIPIRIAKEKNIPFIFWGDSMRESATLIKLKSKIKSVDYKKLRSKKTFVTNVIDKLGKLKEVQMTPFKLIRILPLLIRYNILSTYQLLTMGIPFRYAIFPNKGIPFPEKNPQVVHFFDYIDWNPVKDLKILNDELGWKHPPNKESRFDCTLACFVNHKNLQVDGISVGGLIGSNLIRENMLSRDEVLKKEELAIQTVMDECKDIIKELDLKDYTIPDLTKII